MKTALSRSVCALAIACVAWWCVEGTTCRASVLFSYEMSFDSELFDSNDYLSDLSIFYFVDEPGFPYTNLHPLSYFDPANFGSIPVGGGAGFHYAEIDTLASSPDYAINFGIMGTYNNIDSGAGPSFFCTFSDPSIAVGKTFDEVFGDLNSIEGPYTEQQVLDALQDPLGYVDPANPLILSYMISYMLDTPGIASLFDTPIQFGETPTLVHFSDGTAFGSGSAGAESVFTSVPEPANWVLAASGCLFIGVLRKRRAPSR